MDTDKKRRNRALACNVNTAGTALAMPAGDSYILVLSQCRASVSSAGRRSDGVERVTTMGTCP